MKNRSCMFIGCAGCGKSSWVKRLSLLGYRTVFEDLSDIVFSKDYWRNGAFAFHTQIGFYSLWLRLYNESMQIGGAFIDSSIVSHHFIFTRYMYDTGVLSEMEFRQCEQMFQEIMRVVSCSSVYLQCETEQNLLRLHQRNRDMEKNNEKYICEIKRRFDQYYDMNKCHVPSIDITFLDPDKEDDVSKFLFELKKGGVDYAGYFGGSG